MVGSIQFPPENMIEGFLPTKRRHCDSFCDEAIHSFFTRRDGLLRFARNDDATSSAHHAARLPRAISFCWSNSARRRASSSGSSARGCGSRASRTHPRSSAAATASWCAAGRGFQHTQRQFQRLVLRGHVVRLAGAVAEREIGEQEARHGGVFDDVLGAAHHHGRNAVRLEMARDQGRGLMAHRAFGTITATSTASARQRARISGASVSIVTRWLRLVGAPKKRGATSPIRPAASRRSSCGSGNQVLLSVAVVCTRS